MYCFHSLEFLLFIFFKNFYELEFKNSYLVLIKAQTLIKIVFKLLSRKHTKKNTKHTKKPLITYTHNKATTTTSLKISSSWIAWKDKFAMCNRVFSVNMVFSLTLTMVFHLWNNTCCKGIEKNRFSCFSCCQPTAYFWFCRVR